MTNKHKQDNIDSRIDLIDNSSFRYYVEKDYNYVNALPLRVGRKTKKQINLQTMVGHLTSGDVYKIISRSFDSNTSGFKNATPYDVATVLHELGKLKQKPEEIFKEGQDMIDDFTNLLEYSLRKKPNKLKLTKAEYQDSNTYQPIFGIDFFIDKEINNLEAFWKGVYLGLIMDDYTFRSKSPLGIGGGMCLPVRKSKLQNPEFTARTNIPEYLKGTGIPNLWPLDKSTLSNLDMRNLLGLHTVSDEEVAEKFHENVIPYLINAGLVPEIGEYVQGKDLTPGYLRIKKGTGTADWKAINLAYILWGEDAALGTMVTDVMDTLEKTSSTMIVQHDGYSYMGSQDETLLRRLLKYDNFRDIADQISQPESLLPILEVIYEDPNLNEASVSLRYFTQESKPTNNGCHCSNEKTTVYDEIWYFMEKFPEQFAQGRVHSKLAHIDIGYEHTPSHWYYDRFIQLTHRLAENYEFREIHPLNFIDSQ